MDSEQFLNTISSFNILLLQPEKHFPYYYKTSVKLWTGHHEWQTKSTLTLCMKDRQGM